MPTNTEICPGECTSEKCVYGSSMCPLTCNWYTRDTKAGEHPDPHHQYRLNAHPTLLKDYARSGFVGTIETVHGVPLRLPNDPIPDPYESLNNSLEPARNPDPIYRIDYPRDDSRPNFLRYPTEWVLRHNPKSMDPNYGRRNDYPWQPQIPSHDFSSKYRPVADPYRRLFVNK